MSEQVWTYIGRTKVEGHRWPAGTVVAATVDQPDMAEDTAKMVANWIREGLTVERVPVEWVRQNLLTTTKYVP